MAVVAVVIGCVAAEAQQRVSVHVQEITVQDGKKVTVEKDLYLHPDGRLVVEQSAPQRVIYTTNALGEMRIYDPSQNQVVVADDRQMASDKELLYMFASGSYVDMALPQYGYRADGVRRQEGGVLVKTFVPKAKTQGVDKVELVMQQHLPICMIYYNAKGEPLRKVYFAKYDMGRMPMPMRVTDIEYPSKGDSVVHLSLYSQLLVGGEADSEMFEYKIPADAERVAMGDLLGQAKR